MSETAHTRGMAAISHYVEMRARQPLSSLGDSVHAIHAGTDYEAELRLSDLVRAVKDHADVLRELRDVLEWAKIEKAPLRRQEIESISRVIAKATGAS